MLLLSFLPIAPMVVTIAMLQQLLLRMNIVRMAEILLLLSVLPVGICQLQLNILISNLLLILLTILLPMLILISSPMLDIGMEVVLRVKLIAFVFGLPLTRRGTRPFILLAIVTHLHQATINIMVNPSVVLPPTVPAPLTMMLMVVLVLQVVRLI